MTKAEMLAEIRRIGQSRGGYLSCDAFCAETGVTRSQIVGRYWATWNEAIAAAELTPRSFGRARADEDTTLEAVAQFIERLGHWPTESELSVERHRTKSFPSLKVLRRLKKTETLSRRLVKYCAERPDLTATAAIASSRIDSEPNSAPAARLPIQGYVYMMRSGRRYKIGRTNSPSRRHREVRLDLPDPTSLVHSIETDDPAGIEAYWHRRFSTKRVRDTEFFALDASDVAAFRRRKSQ